MLSSVRIRNFRTCKDVRIAGLDKTPVVALIGKNATGKSNILQAIEWVARTASASVVQQIDVQISPKGDAPIVFVELRFSIEQTVYLYQISISSLLVLPFDTQAEGDCLFQERLIVYQRGWRQRIFLREGTDLRVFPRIRAANLKVRSREERLVLPLQTPALPFLHGVPRVTKPIKQELASVLRFLESIHYYPLGELSISPADSFVSAEAYVAWESMKQRRERVPESVEKKILGLALSDKEGFETLRHLLGPQGLALIEGIRIDSIKRNGNGNTATYWLGFDQQTVNGPMSFDFGHLSQGTRRVIRIVVSLLSDSNSVMLLEHPEDSVHSDLLVNLIATLRAYIRPRQVLLTTHSPFVLNAIEPEEVRLVDLHGGETSVRSLTPKEIKIAAEYTKEEGALSDFLEVVQSG